MDEDAAFLRMIAESPRDDVPRLVYADWLDERGDPRAAYLRTATQAAGRVRPGLPWDDLKPNLREACRAAPADWRGRAGPWFDVVLEAVRPGQKIATVLAVRHRVGLGLVRAKELVESAPAVVRGRLPLEQADDLREGLEVGPMAEGREALRPGDARCRVSLREAGRAVDAGFAPDP